MKSSLTNRTPAAIAFAVMMALTMAPRVARAADDKGVAKPAPGVGQPIDPNTGLPATPPWKDPEWKDPDKVLAEVSYDALPLEFIVEQLRKEFKGAFDVLFPNIWQDPSNPSISVDPR